MTCRVARSYQCLTEMGPVVCSECGLTRQEDRALAKSFGPYLCLACEQSPVECGVPERMTTLSRRVQQSIV
jgi:hypothetical protein